MKRVLLLGLFLTLTLSAFAQTPKLLTISTAQFTTNAGTPRIIRNASKNLWVAVWRQQGAPSKIMARTISATGALAAAKLLVSNVSTVPDNFDLVYDSNTFNYLLIYETAQGLFVQFFNGSLVKQGTPISIEAGAVNASPRLVYDSANRRFIAFWVASKDGVARRTLKDRLLDATGRPTATARTLTSATAGNSYSGLEVARNPLNGNMMAILGELNTANSGTGGVRAFNIKPDGTLLRATPAIFQPNTAGLRTQPSMAFAPSGSGFGSWSDRTAVKYRKVGSTGGFASPSRSLVGEAAPTTTKASIAFDAKNSLFVIAWTVGTQIRAAAINPATGAISKSAFQVAGSNTPLALNASLAVDPVSGNVVIVWEDSTTASPATFRIRGAMFAFSGGGGGGTLAVTIGDNFYTPRTANISTGTTVQWTNSGNASHTVTSGTPDNNPGAVFGSSNLNRGQTFSFRFLNPGSFVYFCQIHGATMSGTVNVQ